MKARPLQSSPRPGQANQPQATPVAGSRSWASRRLALCVLLFVCWLAYLAFLVFTQPKTPSGWPLVLSRPQLLVSELDIVARVEEGGGDKVTVEEVLYPPEGAPVKAGDQITVANLETSRPPQTSEEEPPPDLVGPGSYLMPLRRAGDHYEVVLVPESPGYPPRDTRATRASPRIYPATPEALAQYRAITGSKSQKGQKVKRVKESKSEQD
jgi:hypothetical protein